MNKLSFIPNNQEHTLSFPKSIKSQGKEKHDLLHANKKMFHSPMPSNVSFKISNFDLETKRFSFQNERLLSPENNTPYTTSHQTEKEKHHKINFFVPNLKNSDSKFLQNIKNNFEKNFNLINEAEIKRFTSSSAEDSSFFFNKMYNDKSGKIINFVEINTSKSDDRSGIKYFLNLIIHFF